MFTRIALRTLMNEATGENANGTAPTTAPKVSPLVAIRQKFEADGGKFKDGKPVLTAAQSKAAKAAAKELSEAQTKVDKLQAELDTAKDSLGAASRKVMEATGGTSVTIGGREFIPMSKGDKVYFRGAGQRASVEL